MLSNPQYTANMVKFIDNSICYSMTDILIAENPSLKASLISLDKINKDFTLKLYINNVAIAFRTNLHFSLYNMIYFKSEATRSR